MRASIVETHVHVALSFVDEAPLPTHLLGWRKPLRAPCETVVLSWPARTDVAVVYRWAERRGWRVWRIVRPNVAPVLLSTPE